jgi:hypothetical protein
MAIRLRYGIPGKLIQIVLNVSVTIDGNCGAIGGIVWIEPMLFIHAWPELTVSTKPVPGAATSGGFMMLLDAGSRSTGKSREGRVREARDWF